MMNVGQNGFRVGPYLAFFCLFCVCVCFWDVFCAYSGFILLAARRKIVTEGLHVSINMFHFNVVMVSVFQYMQ